MKSQVTIVLFCLATSVVAASEPSTNQCGLSNDMNGLLTKVGYIFANLCDNDTALTTIILGDKRYSSTMRLDISEITKSMKSWSKNPGTVDAPGNVEKLGREVSVMIKLLDRLLGSGTGQQFACNDSDGKVGKRVQHFLDAINGGSDKYAQSTYFIYLIPIGNDFIIQLDY